MDVCNCLGAFRKRVGGVWDGAVGEGVGGAGGGGECEFGVDGGAVGGVCAVGVGEEG